MKSIIFNNMNGLVSATVCCILLGSLFGAEIEPTIPAVENFLEFLFGTKIAKVVDIAKSFAYTPKAPGRVFFRWYHPDGKNRAYSAQLSNGVPNINLTEPTKIIIHGWQGAGIDKWTQKMAAQYHSIGINNVIVVDWTMHAKSKYLAAAKLVKAIGQLTSNLILKLLKDNEQLNNVHLVGHSLGAHAAGFAAKFVKNSTGVPVSRVTALDAAAPLFEVPTLVPESERLALGDAEFIDGIHTNLGFLGFSSHFANADFFVQYGGPIQPGCMNLNFFDAFVCSNSKAHDFFSNSITTKAYLGIFCPLRFFASIRFCGANEQVPMGEHVSREANGSYYVSVDDKGRPL